MDKRLAPRQQPRQGQKTDMRIVKTREAIASAFIRLLEDTKYPDITVTSIAHEARISRKTFYLHYPSIDELLRELAASNIEEAVDEIRVETLSSSPAEALQQFTMMVFRMFRDYPYLNSNLIRCMPLNSFLAMVREMLMRILDDYFKRNNIECPALSNYWISYYLGGLCAAYETWKTSNGTPEQLDELSQGISASVARTFSRLTQSDDAAF